MSYFPEQDPAYTHPEAWERRVQELEAEGLTRSDAQGIADLEASRGADWASGPPERGERNAMCKITPADQEALDELPKNGWFLADFLPIKRPKYRCQRLEKAGALESRIIGEFPNGLRTEYRRTDCKKRTTENSESNKIPPTSAADPGPALPKKDAWVAALGDGGELPQIARVRDSYRLSGDALLDLVMYSQTGEKLGRISPALDGPKGFEPCCNADGWVEIERPDFGRLAKAAFGYRSLLVPKEIK